LASLVFTCVSATAEAVITNTTIEIILIQDLSFPINC
jgi:hypothetical protein